MLWTILGAVILMGLWGLNALNVHMEGITARQIAQHEETMAYLRYLKDLVAASRTEIRSAAGLPSFGEEVAGWLRPKGDQAE